MKKGCWQGNAREEGWPREEERNNNTNNSSSSSSKQKKKRGEISVGRF